MYESLGAREMGDTRKVLFQLFIPDENLAPSQYGGGGLPRIAHLYVIGDFQPLFHSQAWTVDPAFEMHATPYPAPPDLAKGQLYTFTTQALPEGFYQYKFFVAFINGETRIVSDPCTLYGGRESENSAVVVGGNDVDVNALVNPLPPQDLIIYEVMIDDFTQQFLKGRAPLDALADKLDYLVNQLGVNAIEFMPWTAWPWVDQIGQPDYSWGYNPFAYFSVAHKYTLDPTNPVDKIVYLKQLINACHQRGLHVLLDCVFNHADGSTPYRGFAYYWLYQNPADCPYVGTFAQGGFFQDLDYNNRCTLEFICDVSLYWIDAFKIDGIRFDDTQGFYDATRRDVGLPKLLSQLRAYLADHKRSNFTLTLEHAWDYSSIDVVNKVGATSCWYDDFRSLSASYLQNRQVQPGIMRMLNSGRDFASNRYATIYLENHDHETFMLKAGSRDEWWRTQPYVIALFTCPGAVLIHNGQEIGVCYGMPEPGQDTPSNPRVKSRPIDWNNQGNDAVGQKTFWLYQKLITMRKAYPGLRSNNFYPDTWDESVQTLDSDGFGVDVARNLAVYHRYGPDNAGATEYFYVVLNFSQQAQTVEFSVRANGNWTELLNNTIVNIANNRVRVDVPANWGLVYYQKA